MSAASPEGLWFSKADRGLRAADLALATTPPMPDIACYHAQQCAEKYLKGYLIVHGTRFRYVHELAYLASLCAKTDPSFGDLLEAAATLQDYASDVRYPEEDGAEPTAQDAMEAIRLARLIRDYIRTRVVA